MRFKVGDLVSCAYDFFDFFNYYWYEDDEERSPYRVCGIVVSIAPPEHDTWFDEAVYQIYCTDGKYRFFLEDEIKLIEELPLDTMK